MISDIRAIDYSITDLTADPRERASPVQRSGGPECHSNPPEPNSDCHPSLPILGSKGPFQTRVLVCFASTVGAVEASRSAGRTTSPANRRGLESTGLQGDVPAEWLIGKSNRK